MSDTGTVARNWQGTRSEIRVEGDVAYVPLARGYEAIIDASDVPLVEGKSWHPQVKFRADGEVMAIYAVSNVSAATNGKQHQVLMHRLIAQTPSGLFTDHIDRNGLNNRRANLRDATRAQNTRNQGISSSNTSGSKGVTWNKASKMWQAQIKVNRRTHYLGLYVDIESAAAAYAKASADLHGEFGRTE